MSLRLLTKTVAAEALCRTGADRLLSRGSGVPALVLGYHQVVDDAHHVGASIPAMAISTDMLERQLDWVGRDFRFVTLAELAPALGRGAAAGRPMAAVTFDDGYLDVYERARPLLERKGIPAAVFVVTDLVGTGRLLLHDRLHIVVTRLLALPPAARAALIGGLDGDLRGQVVEAAAGRGAGEAFPAMRALFERVPSEGLERLIQALGPEVGLAEEEFPELRLMDWAQVRALQRAGFTIGSHTCTHAPLTLEGPEEVRHEVAHSRRRLEDELGAPVRHFAYPDGRFDGAVLDAVAEAGYCAAFTNCRHRDRRRPALSVPRRLLWENSCRDGAGRFSPSLMQGLVRGVFDRFGRCRQAH
jgi:peptidoglycan/xylan/chitin deacetylase (PgdA/CDA1 family)